MLFLSGTTTTKLTEVVESGARPHRVWERTPVVPGLGWLKTSDRGFQAIQQDPILKAKDITQPFKWV